MTESTLVTILNGPGRRWIGMAWATLIVGMIVIPGIDDALGQYRMLGDLKAKQAARDELPERARILRDRVAQQRDAADRREALLVPPEALSEFKQDVTQKARRANCQIRSIRPGPVTTRSLAEVLGGAPEKPARGNKGAQWQVEACVSAVSVQGTFAALMAYVGSLDAERRIIHVDSIHVQPSTETPNVIVVDLQLRTFNLRRNSRT